MKLPRITMENLEFFLFANNFFLNNIIPEIFCLKIITYELFKE